MHLILHGTKVPGRVEQMQTRDYSLFFTWYPVTVTLVLMPPGGESVRLTTRGYRFEQELESLRRGWVEVLLDPAKPTEFLVL